MIADRVLIDTSVWIEYFRNRSPHVIDQSESTWTKAGRLSFDLKQQGKTIHIVDCYIAVIAQEHHCQVFTMDRHFKDIEKAIGLDLHTIE